MIKNYECLLATVRTVEILVVGVDVRQSVRDTFDTITRATAIRHGKRALLCFEGWDDDPREIFDIPEAQRWCREFVEMGGLSLVVGLDDMPAEVQDLPSQFRVVACAGMNGVKRFGHAVFGYDPCRISQLERQYRPQEEP